MKKGIRILALALVFAVLLPSSLAMAVTSVDIDDGDVYVGVTEYAVGASSPAPHDGAVSITSSSGNATENTVNVGTSEGPVDVSISGVDFVSPTTSADPEHYAVIIQGGGTANVELTDVSINTGGVGIIVPDDTTANLSMTGVEIITSGSELPNIMVIGGSLNIDVNGANTASSAGSSLWAAGGDISISGDSAGDSLTFTGGSTAATIIGVEEGNNLTVNGTATVKAVNTVGGEPIEGFTVTGYRTDSVAGNAKTATILSGPPSGDTGGDSTYTIEQQQADALSRLMKLLQEKLGDQNIFELSSSGHYITLTNNPQKGMIPGDIIIPQEDKLMELAWWTDFLEQLSEVGLLSLYAPDGIHSNLDFGEAGDLHQWFHDEDYSRKLAELEDGDSQWHSLWMTRDEEGNIVLRYIISDHSVNAPYAMA